MANRDVTMHLKVHVHKLCEEIMCNPGTALLKIPLVTLMDILNQVGQRASELNDLELNALMMRLNLYSVADPTDENYNPQIVHKTIEAAYRSKKRKKVRNKIIKQPNFK